MVSDAAGSLLVNVGLANRWALALNELGASALSRKVIGRRR
jgi:hypothetical protein